METGKLPSNTISQPIARSHQHHAAPSPPRQGLRPLLALVSASDSAYGLVCPGLARKQSLALLAATPAALLLMIDTPHRAAPGLRVAIGHMLYSPHRPTERGLVPEGRSCSKAVLVWPVRKLIWDPRTGPVQLRRRKHDRMDPAHCKNIVAKAVGQILFEVDPKVAEAPKHASTQVTGRSAA